MQSRTSILLGDILGTVSLRVREKHCFNFKIMNIYGLVWGFDIGDSSPLVWLFLATLPDLGWQGLVVVCVCVGGGVLCSLSCIISLT